MQADMSSTSEEPVDSNSDDDSSSAFVHPTFLAEDSAAAYFAGCGIEPKAFSPPNGRSTYLSSAPMKIIDKRPWMIA